MIEGVRPTLSPDDEGYEQFDPRPRDRVELLSAERALEQFVLADGVDKAELGSRFGNQLARGIAGATLNEQNLKEMYRFHERFQRILPPDDYAMMKSGFMGEVGGRLAFAEHHIDVFYSTVEEDTRDGVDLWAHLGDQSGRLGKDLLGIQIKTLPLRQGALDWVLAPLRNTRDIERVATEMYTVANWDLGDDHLERAFQQAGDQRLRFIHGAYRLLAKCQQFSNTEAAVMAVTSPATGHGMINTVTGKLLASPGSEQSILGKLLGRDLNRYFLNVDSKVMQ